MTQIPIVVVGASAGGIEALQGLVAGLPYDFAGALCVVLHLHPHSSSALPEILAKAGPLPVRHARDGEAVRVGHIYVAPPDHHLLVDGDRLAVTKGPKENRFRPAIDALFRSAAYTCARGVIGVVLSGVLDDGVSGLWTIKRLGGTAVVQDPGEAAFDPMPRHALEQVAVDHQVGVREMGPLLARLVREAASDSREITISDAERERLEIEVGIAARGPDSPLAVRRLGDFSPYSCPECQGVLVEFMEGRQARYRCHTGHAFSAAGLLDGISESIENKLYQTQRAMEEGIILLRQLGAQTGQLSGPQLADLLDRVRQVEQRAHVIHDLAFTQAPLVEEKL